MSDLLIKAGRIFDGESERVQERGFVTVREGVIGEVGAQSGLGAEDGRFGRVIELGADATLLPGLINMHTHMSFSAGGTVFHDASHDGNERLAIRAVANLGEALRCGTTTVRDCGTLNPVAFAMRAAVEEGLVAGPRIIASGHGITTSGGHCHFCSHEADSAEAVRAAVRTQVEAGADFIKVFSTGGNTTPGSDPVAAQYDEAAMRACTAEAKRLGKAVASHAHGTAGVRHSIAAGVTTIEHCTFQTAEGIRYDPELAQRIADEGIAVCPTVFRGITKPEVREQYAGTPQLRALEEALPRRFENLRRLYELGVRIVAGTDAGVRHSGFGDYPHDLALMASGPGLAPLLVLRAATSAAADCLDLSHIGRIAPGKAADLLGVASDPLADLSALAEQRLVVARGQVVVG